MKPNKNTILYKIIQNLNGMSMKKKTVKFNPNFQPPSLHNLLKNINSNLQSLNLSSLVKSFAWGSNVRPKFQKNRRQVLVKRTFLSNRIIIVQNPQLPAKNK